MNCNDIALLLDDGDTGRLEAGVRQDLDAHLALCADCARDWRLHERLVARRIAPMPAGLVEACRALVVAGVQRGSGNRARNRFLVIGAVAMAAAAAMLVAYLKGGTASPVVALADATPVPAVMAMPMEDAAGQTPAAAEGIPPVNRAEAPPAAAAEPFTVRVLPLRNEATDAARAAAVESFHQAVLQQLRAIPGLMLLPAAAAQVKAEPVAEYVLTVSGGDASARNEFSAAVMLDAQPMPGGGYSARMGSVFSGDLSKACADSRPAALSDCRDPLSLAIRAVGMLRVRAFPADPLLRQQIEARLNDPSQSPEARFQAFTELASLRQPALHQPDQSTAGILSEPAVLQGAIALAAVSTDPRQRAELWRAMRGVGGAVLLQPLVEASRLDPDPAVRAQATATLAADFADDPRGSAALETLAGEDSSALVRALARRGLSGDAGWKQYVAASLVDATRPAAERVEALLFHMRGPSPPGSRAMLPWSAMGELLDGNAIQALVGVYADAFEAASIEHKSMLNSLLTDLAYHSGHPAVTDLVLQNLTHGARRMDWLLPAEGLLRRPDADPRVREALQGIANTSVDEQLRKAADGVLQRAHSPSS